MRGKEEENLQRRGIRRITLIKWWRKRWGIRKIIRKCVCVFFLKKIKDNKAVYKRWRRRKKNKRSRKRRREEENEKKAEEKAGCLRNKTGIKLLKKENQVRKGKKLEMRSMKKKADNEEERRELKKEEWNIKKREKEGKKEERIKMENKKNVEKSKN